MKYDHHCTPPERKMKNVPVIASKKLFLVNSINSRKVLIRKKKILKFQENANALSTSKMKYDQICGLNRVLISFTGNPHTTGAFRSPTDSFFNGIPA